MNMQLQDGLDLSFPKKLKIGILLIELKSTNLQQIIYLETDYSNMLLIERKEQCRQQLTVIQL